MNTEIQFNDYTFRIKPMNMIEVLALQSQLTFENTDETVELYNEILERMEVKLDEKWLPVKQKKQNVYYPCGIENDYSSVKTLIRHFLSYIRSVFQKSDE